MKADEIRELVKIVEESNIAELELSRWGQKVRIRKVLSNSSYNSGTGHIPVPAASMPAAPTPGVTPTPTPPIPAAPTMAAPAPALRPAVKEEKEIIEVRSPMVGTFYRAPAPDADPYVEVGDLIAPGQVLCIIEAMKLMNEIEAEVSGRIVEVCVENGQPVEYNQALFRVEKA